VRPALAAREPPAPRVLSRPADEQRLGLRGRTRYWHRDGSRPPPAREDRGRPVAAAPSRDRLGRRLQVHGVIELGLAVALGTLAVGVAAVFLLRLLPTLRLQLAGLAFLSVVLPLGAVLLSGWVMFHMGDDVKILGVAAASATAAVGAALLLGGSIARRVERLRG